MSQSPFKISGKERRKLKKELSEAKRLLKFNPMFLDLETVYGTVSSPEVNEQFISRLNKKIAEAELALSETNEASQ